MRVAVFGYGAVGREIAVQLAARGDEVTVAQRRRPAVLPKGTGFAACDVTEAAAVKNICTGRDVVICAAGFPYDSRVWATSWPEAMTALLDGCAGSGARFVFADNLYMLGPQTPPLTEDMTLTSFGRKPRIRSEITRMWQAAHTAGRVRAVAVRASDFYGPDAPNSVFAAFGVARLLAGKPALVPYDPDQPHDMTYVPDFARAIVTLADAPDDAYGQAWNVPNAPPHTRRELLALAAAIAGVECRVQVLPQWLLPVIGLFRREVYEIAEMRFQSDRPYFVDTSKYAARFGGSATSFEDGMVATVDFYRSAT
ncbi:MAG: NAD-dependent epimerase/dehydratase family protein [Acidiphilium sp.]|nr:NAD-dependent epimerase/dehydratase family protein [Acidiphilium sp.]MDD4936730.1 NAD-dependent epimerase/dehydratase family protein [Acidiphilium sp.]